MGIGVSLFLIVIGAILTFAVDTKVAALNLEIIGWILMSAGAAGLVLFVYFWQRRHAARSYDDTGGPLV
jgi:hypothetical protein